MMTANIGGHLPPALFDCCEIAHLVAMARQNHLSFYIADNGCVVRPIRNATPDRLRLHAALIARRDEVGTYLLVTRPRPFDPDAEADAASWRVCRMPYEALVALTMHELNQSLAAADRGTLRYEPESTTTAPNVQPTTAGRRTAKRQAIPSDRVAF